MGQRRQGRARLYDIPDTNPRSSRSTVLRMYGDFFWANIVETRKHVESLAMAHQNKKHVEHWMQDESWWYKSSSPPMWLCSTATRLPGRFADAQAF